jgi:hypothetical protein
MKETLTHEIGDISMRLLLICLTLVMTVSVTNAEQINQTNVEFGQLENIYNPLQSEDVIPVFLQQVGENPEGFKQLSRFYMACCMPDIYKKYRDDDFALEEQSSKAVDVMIKVANSSDKEKIYTYDTTTTLGKYDFGKEKWHSNERVSMQVRAYQNQRDLESDLQVFSRDKFSFDMFVPKDDAKKLNIEIQAALNVLYPENCSDKESARFPIRIAYKIDGFNDRSRTITHNTYKVTRQYILVYKDLERKEVFFKIDPHEY